MAITFIVLGLVAGVFIYMIISARRHFKSIKNLPDGKNIRHLNDQNFSASIKSGTILVDFWAGWCMPCQMMVPVLNELSEELAGKVTIAKIDIDAAKSTASRFAVRSIPTMILFRNGKEVHRFVGVKTKDQLLKQIK